MRLTRVQILPVRRNGDSSWVNRMGGETVRWKGSRWFSETEGCA